MKGKETITYFSRYIYMLDLYWAINIPIIGERINFGG